MPPTMTKHEADYYYPSTSEHCRDCTMFIRRSKASGCTLVKGQIMPLGTCKHFTKETNHAVDE